jgi:hypothetical protein
MVDVAVRCDVFKDGVKRFSVFWAANALDDSNGSVKRFSSKNRFLAASKFCLIFSGIVITGSLELDEAVINDAL